MNTTAFTVSCLMAGALAIRTKSLTNHSMAPNRVDLAQIKTITATVPEKPLSLAQLDTPTCTSTADRNKADLPKFYNIIDGSEKYTDTEFGHDNNALYWSDLSESWNKSDLEWHRASTLLKDGQNLWGSNGVTPKDVWQG